MLYLVCLRAPILCILPLTAEQFSLIYGLGTFVNKFDEWISSPRNLNESKVIFLAVYVLHLSPGNYSSTPSEMSRS